MDEFAIISNARSGRNRRRRQDLLADADGLRIWRAPELPELPALIDEVLATRPPLLVVDGGDGTVQAVVTELLRRLPPDQLPPLAVLPSGSTNMTARDLGSGTHWNTAARSLLALRDAEPEAWAITRRAALRIARDDTEAVDHGFFLGTGSIVRGIEFWHEEMAKGGRLGEWGAGLALARAAWGIWRRQPPFADPARYRLVVDGDRRLEGAALFLLVTTMRELFLGIRPFWGDDSGPLACTLVSDEPRRFLPRVPGLLRGDASVGLTPEEGYESLRGGQIELEVGERYAIDGELLPACGQLRIDATQPLRFVRLGTAP